MIPWNRRSRWRGIRAQLPVECALSIAWKPRSPSRGIRTNRIPEKTAVAGVMQQGGGDRAVQPDDLASLDFRLTRAGKQGAIDRFPSLGSDGADRVVQHRFLRGPRQRQPREGSE